MYMYLTFDNLFIVTEVNILTTKVVCKIPSIAILLKQETLLLN